MKFKLNKKQTTIVIIVIILILAIFLSLLFSVKTLQYENFDSGAAVCSQRNDVTKKKLEDWTSSDGYININNSNYQTYSNNFIKLQTASPLIDFTGNTDSNLWNTYIYYASGTDSQLTYINSAGLVTFWPLINNSYYKISVTPSTTGDSSDMSVTKLDDAKTIPCTYYYKLTCDQINKIALNGKINENLVINNKNYYDYRNGFTKTGGNPTISFSGNTDLATWTTYILFVGRCGNLQFTDSANNQSDPTAFPLNSNAVYQITVTPGLSPTDLSITQIGTDITTGIKLVPCNTANPSQSPKPGQSPTPSQSP